MKFKVRLGNQSKNNFYFDDSPVHLRKENLSFPPINESAPIVWNILRKHES